MSRIHEALKKAEQERAASPAAPAEMPIPAGANPASAVAVDSDAATIFRSSDVKDSLSAQPQGPLTFDQLSANCARPHWSPDLKT
ncbi:MAG: hypothetical protein HY046_05535, partial [Acidobacteria bacterium]|nr:hypothetical protein [Acidobacteriota bacterium]